MDPPSALKAELKLNDISLPQRREGAFSFLSTPSAAAAAAGARTLELVSRRRKKKTIALVPESRDSHSSFLTADI